MTHLRAILLALSLLTHLTGLARAQSTPPPAAPPLQIAPPSAPVGPQVNVPASDEPPGYVETVDAAIREHELSHFQEARELLLKAHALFPNARTLRGLGKVEYELRNYGQAVNYLEQALTSQVRPLDARLRAEVEGLLTRAHAYVGEVHVDVEPSTAQVIVDGVTVASGPQASFSLVVGDHLIEFQAAGHFPQRRAVRVKGGEQTSIQVVLDAPLTSGPLAGKVKAEDAAHDGAHDDRARARRRWLAWTLSAAAVAGAAVAIGLAFRDDPSGHADGGSSGVVLRNP